MTTVLLPDGSAKRLNRFGQPPPATRTHDMTTEEQIHSFRQSYAALRAEIGKVIVGNDEIVEAPSSPPSPAGTSCLRVFPVWARRCWSAL